MYLANSNLSTLAKLAKVIFGLEGSQILLVHATGNPIGNVFLIIVNCALPSKQLKVYVFGLQCKYIKWITLKGNKLMPQKYLYMT